MITIVVGGCTKHLPLLDFSTVVRPKQIRYKTDMGSTHLKVYVVGQGEIDCEFALVIG